MSREVSPFSKAVRLARLASLIVAAAYSEASDWGTIVRVLPEGMDCIVADQRAPCSEVAQHLGPGVALSDPVTVFVLQGDGVTESQRAAVARALKDAGFTNVKVAKVGFITEPGEKTQDRR